VTSGIFTSDAQAFAKGRNIELIDGPALAVMIESARVAHKVSPPIEKGARPAVAPARAVPAAPAAEPTCLRCGSAMVKRIAKQGANAGSAFWGCTAFPKCRGVRAAD
jgi:restriction system protein